jgi:hypothetical protein
MSPEPWCSVELSHELLARELEDFAQTWAAPIRLVADVDATVAQAVQERIIERWVADNADTYTCPPTILRKICVGVLELAAMLD